MIEQWDGQTWFPHGSWNVVLGISSRTGSHNVYSRAKQVNQLSEKSIQCLQPVSITQSAQLRLHDPCWRDALRMQARPELPVAKEAAAGQRSELRGRRAATITHGSLISFGPLKNKASPLPSQRPRETCSVKINTKKNFNNFWMHFWQWKLTPNSESTSYIQTNCNPNALLNNHYTNKSLRRKYCFQSRLETMGFFLWISISLLS